MEETTPGDPLSPAHRVVLLGASNLTRAISTVVQTARLGLGSRLQVLAALGHGRSYGIDSSVLGRRLPGIHQCGLWPYLNASQGPDPSPCPTSALVTDLGNDLLYEIEVHQILDWIETCLDRLADVQARITIMSLPMEGLGTLSAARYRFFRTLLFPKCNLSLDETVARATELNHLVYEVGRRRRIPVVAPPHHWYGVDPIHIKMRYWREAWHAMIEPLVRSTGPCPLADASFRRWIYLRRLAPEKRWWFGVPQQCKQPAGAFEDGTTISYF